MQFVEKLRNWVAQSLGRLDVAVRVAVILLACLVAGGLIFWLCNELAYFYIARSYADELADGYNLNQGVMRAVLWTSFAAIMVLAGFTFSFSKHSRTRDCLLSQAVWRTAPAGVTRRPSPV